MLDASSVMLSIASQCPFCHCAPFEWDSVFKVKSKLWTNPRKCVDQKIIVNFSSLKGNSAWVLLEDCWSVLGQQQLQSYLHPVRTHKINAYCPYIFLPTRFLMFWKLVYWEFLANSQKLKFHDVGMLENWFFGILVWIFT